MTGILPMGLASDKLAFRPLIGSGSDLSVTDADPFIRRQFLKSHRAARTDLVRADADLGAHAEFAAIGETGGSIPIDRRRIDLKQELPRVLLAFCDDAIGMRRTVAIDVVDRGAYVIHDAYVKDVIIIFCGPVLLRRDLEPQFRVGSLELRAQECVCGVIGAEFDIFFSELL